MNSRTARRRRQRKNNRIFSFIFIFIICIAVGICYLCSSPKRMQQEPQQNETGSLPFTADVTGTDENDTDIKRTDSLEEKNDNAGRSSVNEEEWCLTLVNRWNPLQTDGSEVETTELSNGERVDVRIYPQLQKMFDDARADGVYPIVASGYRTQSEQEQIYNDKIAEGMADGLSQEAAKTEAERWVSIPGTSEHQLGLAVDINADGIHSAGYEVYDWLADNAYKYGFINRYPSDKTAITGVANEPWHYRYVGLAAAADIYSQGVCLEEYLQ